MKVAFIGLGNMGYPMAGHWAQKGFDVTVFNRTTSKAQAWVKDYGGNYQRRPAKAVQGAECVALCVGRDDDVRQVMLGRNGILAGVTPGTYILDHTTTSCELAQEMAQRAQKVGAIYMDIPVSGGQAGAQNGVLTAFVGGTPRDYEAIQKYVGAYCAKTRLIGPVGQAQLAKMVNQICIVSIIQGLSEALAFGMREGLPMEKVVKAMEGGAAGSWQMSNRAYTMLEGRYDFGFAVDWMRKDLGICLERAKKNGVNLHNTQEIDQFYARVQALGGGRWDTSSLIERLKRKD